MVGASAAALRWEAFVQTGLSPRERPERPRVRCASRVASVVNACAAGDSGSVSTTGVPASEPSRTAVSRGYLGEQFHLGAGGGRKVPRDRGTAAAAEDLHPGAVGHLHPRHVLHDTGDRLLGLRGDGTGPLGDLSRGLLGGGDDEELGVRQQLRDGDCDVAGAGRQVEEEDVEVTPEDVGEELLQGAVEHRAPPHDGLVAGDEHADAHHFHPVGDLRDDHLVDAGRLTGEAEHRGDGEPVDVGVDETDAQALLRKCRGEVRCHRGLPDPPLPEAIA